LLLVVSGCKKSSIAEINHQENINEPIKFEVEPLNIPSINQDKIDIEKITYLQKVDEIREDFSKEKYNFFSQITDLCVDKEDNLYIADSKLYKIFKFNKKREYMTSFGRGGQGSGEFLGRLRISSGNDGNLYVTDNKIFRLYKFSPNGELIRQYNIPEPTYDVASANSGGNIYLISKSGIKLIDCYDSSFSYLDSCLEMKYHLNFPFKNPPNKIIKAMLRTLTCMKVHKLISRDDHLFVIIDNSHVVIQLDQKSNILNQFKIDHPRFVKDYRERVMNIKKDNFWPRSFMSVFLDDRERICICYYNKDLNIPEIYRYESNGKFVDTIRFKDSDVKSNWFIKACDSLGNFFVIDKRVSQVSVYRIFKE